VIRSAATSGEARQIQAPTATSRGAP
jgi:hypothetical protein